MDLKADIKEEPLFDLKEEFIHQNFDIKCESNEDGSHPSGCFAKLCSSETSGIDCASTRGAHLQFKVEPQLGPLTSSIQVLSENKPNLVSSEEAVNRICITPPEEPSLYSSGKSVYTDCDESSLPASWNQMEVLRPLVPAEIHTVNLPPLSPVPQSNMKANSSDVRTYFHCSDNLSLMDESEVDPLAWERESVLKKESQEPSHPCPQCSEQFDSAEDLNEHVVVHSIHKCTICFRHCKTDRELRRHLKYHPKKKQIPPKLRFPCPHCSRKYSSKVKVREHIHVNHGIYACAYCSDTFASKKKVKKHLSNVHFHEYPCPLCPQKFRLESLLKQHLSQVHSTKDFLFHCAHCPGKFKKIHDIKRHLEVHFRVRRSRRNV
ncbi:unnamed protein product [Bemisia tabaci]|uniref:C2H2-type domain-containing protein n=1 Tax=Bemisia tabaci TaxID=7038 RepID=A0A9N9ZYP1_BEMTA|nr:unnamed protein product [Bemisia tabaci]